MARPSSVPAVLSSASTCTLAGRSPLATSVAYVSAVPASLKLSDRMPTVTPDPVRPYVLRAAAARSAVSPWLVAAPACVSSSSDRANRSADRAASFGRDVAGSVGEHRPAVAGHAGPPEPPLGAGQGRRPAGVGVRLDQVGPVPGRGEQGGVQLGQRAAARRHGRQEDAAFQPVGGRTTIGWRSPGGGAGDAACANPGCKCRGGSITERRGERRSSPDGRTICTVSSSAWTGPGGARPAARPSGYAGRRRRPRARPWRRPVRPPVRGD